MRALLLAVSTVAVWANAADAHERPYPHAHGPLSHMTAPARTSIAPAAAPRDAADARLAPAHAAPVPRERSAPRTPPAPR